MNIASGLTRWLLSRVAKYKLDLSKQITNDKLTILSRHDPRWRALEEEFINQKLEELSKTVIKDVNSQIRPLLVTLYSLLAVIISIITSLFLVGTCRKIYNRCRNAN